ncbi:MAG: outer membrane beta-barrel family protein [Chitinophagaceae bacterium]
MKRITSLIAAIQLLTLAAFAQKAMVKGIVRNETKAPIAYASVEVKAGGKTIKSTVSDADGLFTISTLSNGAFSVEVSAVGYTTSGKEFMIDSLHQCIEFAAFDLQVATRSLGSVTVVAKKKFIEIKADKIILNVENNIMASGSSAFDMIKKGPAVSVDKDDNLKLKGGLAQIYIDGKPSYLSGQQLTDYLKNLTADAVSRIEIISNPSSKYEAQGSAGIINIKLKKSKNEGLNGAANIGGGIGRYPKAYGGVSMNYRKNNINLFGNLNLGRYKSFNLLNYNSIIGTGAEATYQDRENFWNPIVHSGTLKLGLDYSIGKKSTLGFLINGNAAKQTAPTDNYTIFKDTNQQPYNYINSHKSDESHNANTSYNINFKTEPDTLGSELNIDADFAQYNADREDINSNEFLDKQLAVVRSPYVFRNQTPAQVNIVSFKADLTRYLAAGLKIEAGLKSSFVKSDNNLIADSISAGKWEADNDRSNHFIYEENINAAYISVNKEWKKLSLQAGLRGEQTNYTSNSVTSNQVAKKSYTSFFPTVFASYKANDNNTFNVSYARRINRPSYQSLNPFINYVDPYTVFKGNPYLLPSFSNSFELKHSYKDFLFTSLSFTHRSRESGLVILQDAVTKVTTNISQNIGYSNYAGLDVTLSLPVTKWWTMENNAGVYLSNSVSEFTGYEYNTSNVSANLSSDNTFTLPKNYKIQASVYYSAPSRDGYTKQRSSAGGSLGIQKQLWEKKASLKFSISNIGNNAYRAHLQSNLLDITWRNQWEGPRFSLSFTWKFGSSSIKANRQRRTASSDESNRVNL